MCSDIFYDGENLEYSYRGKCPKRYRRELDFLDEQGIVHGMAKKKVNCSELAAAVRRKFTETTWVSARIEGTRLILELQEELLKKKILRIQVLVT